MQKIKTFLWFDNQAEEAANHYVSIFGGDSKVLGVTHYTEASPGEPGAVMTVEFRLAGQEYIALNGGPQFPFTEAISLSVDCESQAEVDELWAKLTDGGEESQCGWLKDKYGLSWQIVPRGLSEALSDPDPAKADRAMKAMLGMKKLDIEALLNA
ncbi:MULTISPECIES: VOC family protein [unclassified Streptomyces]|jgi:predicted 3-demethylubiquinone-9 3-methyltransferase (glyoxalase superfamily)|uniref:VOC family protein n=1 Tax=unclassified Streptomyces TaxID=2593676 RepID=UPI002DDA1B40|nr:MULTISPECIES: VOC family protein [unclassified Streptomyces]WSF85004.1 VOC family protein [Streptomyces sp. NBC_01744]WTC80162.1 VOC family protein [Streptomyces sp. NBC_01653]WTD35289.1 VOC family protein [Streptomyces sp. NBC_01643]WTD90702.1 VOC family protein [Streptomyces sp. NBC_01637]WSC38707.1 VOC family protein [Streptomyces sp. NBC_01763]